jgi:hypothetical protein
MEMVLVPSQEKKTKSGEVPVFARGHTDGLDLGAKLVQFAVDEVDLAEELPLGLVQQGEGHVGVLNLALDDVPRFRYPYHDVLGDADDVEGVVDAERRDW